MRTASIRIRKAEESLQAVRAGFLSAWKGGKWVHEDAAAMIEVGMVEKTEDGKLVVPFDEIRADFVMRPAA